jgi:hypothetical protein
VFRPAVLQYNMYHKRPMDAQKAQPTPVPEGGRSERPEHGGREPAASGHADRGAILAEAAVSPPGPQRIIAQMLGACGIQVQVQVRVQVRNFQHVKIRLRLYRSCLLGQGGGGGCSSFER